MGAAGWRMVSAYTGNTGANTVTATIMVTATVVKLAWELQIFTNLRSDATDGF